jgi:hypothetical protein
MMPLKFNFHLTFFALIKKIKIYTSFFMYETKIYTVYMNMQPCICAVEFKMSISIRKKI